MASPLPTDRSSELWSVDSLEVQTHFDALKLQIGPRWANEVQRTRIERLLRVDRQVRAPGEVPPQQAVCVLVGVARRLVRLADNAGTSLDRCKNSVDRWAIPGPCPDVMKSHNAFGVNQHVAPLLRRVGDGSPGPHAPECLPRVGFERGRPDQVSGARQTQAVSLVERTLLIHEDRATHACFVPIGRCGRASFEGHHHDADSQFAKREVGLLQLQQVSPAGESEKVAVQHQKKPRPEIILEHMYTSLGVREPEGSSGTSKPSHPSDYCDFLSLETIEEDR